MGGGGGVVLSIIESMFLKGKDRCRVKRKGTANRSAKGLASEIPIACNYY